MSHSSRVRTPLYETASDSRRRSMTGALPGRQSVCPGTRTIPLAGGMLDGDEEEGEAEVSIASSTEQDARHFPIRDNQLRCAKTRGRVAPRRQRADAE